MRRAPGAPIRWSTAFGRSASQDRAARVCKRETAHQPPGRTPLTLAKGPRTLRDGAASAPSRAGIRRLDRPAPTRVGGSSPKVMPEKSGESNGQIAKWRARRLLLGQPIWALPRACRAHGCACAGYRADRRGRLTAEAFGARSRMRSETRGPRRNAVRGSSSTPRCRGRDPESGTQERGRAPTGR